MYDQSALKKKVLPKTEWDLHWEKIARENPHLKTNKARQKKACEEWIKLKKK